MVAALIVVLVVAWCIVWLLSGKSPFLLAAMGLLFLEAVRAEAWFCIVPAGRIFARRVRRRFVSVRAEIGVAA